MTRRPAPEKSSSQSLKALLGLRDLVFSGEVGPGERLSEIIVSERLGLSRTPIRAALASLSRLIAAATGLGLATMGGYLMLDDWTVPLAGAPLPSGLKFLGLALGGLLILIFALERLFTGAPKTVRED